MGVRSEAPGLPGMWASSRFSDLPKAGTRTASLSFSAHCAVPSPPPPLGPLPRSSTSFFGIALGVITSPSRQSLFSRCGTQKTPLNPSAFRRPLPLRCPRELCSGTLSALLCIWATGSPARAESNVAPSGQVPSQDKSPLSTGPLRTGPLSALDLSGLVLSGQVLSGLVPSRDWSPKDRSPLGTGSLSELDLSGQVPSGLVPSQDKFPSQHRSFQDWSPLRTGPLRTGPLSELVLSGQVPSGLVPSQDRSPLSTGPLRTGSLRTGPLRKGPLSGLGPLSGQVPSRDRSPLSCGSPLRTGPQGLTPHSALSWREGTED